MTTPKTLTLIEKLVQVALAVRYIEKGGKNSAQNYKFVGEAQVVAAVGPKLLELGVLAYPRHKMIGDPIPFTTKNGSSQFLTTIESTWVFTDGASELEVVTIGQGSDSGDKGVYKAMTGAKKYGLLQALMIATGDDPEEDRADEKAETTTRRAKKDESANFDEEEVDPNKATTAQIGRMFGLAKDAGIDTTAADGKKILQAIVLAISGRHSSKQLKKADMDGIYAELESIADQAAKDEGEDDGS